VVDGEVGGGCFFCGRGVMCEGSTERTNGVEEGEEGVLRERERMGSK